MGLTPLFDLSFLLMSSKISNHQMAMDLISQYGDDAESIAMLRAAEHAANVEAEALAAAAAAAKQEGADEV